MGDFNIIQILLVAIVTFIAAIDQFSFLECIYQPIILGPIIGAILGDLELGLAVGGSYQLVQIGSMPIGGAQPPNVVVGGIMATIFAISSNTAVDNVGTVIGLAIPFAVIGQYIVVAMFSLTSPLMALADKYAEEANPSGITRLNLLYMAILGTLFAVIAVLGILFGSELGKFLQSISVEYSWLMAGLGAAGGMMRYVGFAILMKIMLSNDLWGFYFAGFAFATILSTNPATSGAALLLTAFIGVAIALYDFQTNVKMKSTSGGTTGGGVSDGI